MLVRDLKRVAVIGAKGALGSAISIRLQGHGMDVLEVSRTTENWTFADKTIGLEPQENRVFYPQSEFFDAVILANRSRKSSTASDADFSIENFLRANSNPTTVVINLASYIERYSFNQNTVNSSYQREKIQQSRELERLATELKFKFINLHLFTVYGQKDTNESFFNQIIKAANLGHEFPSTPGQQLISLTHIDDILECILRILNENLPAIYEVSFWSTPPVKLVEAIDSVFTVSKPGFNVLYGARSYSGHELFTYNPEIFPPQIYPDYKFLDFADGVVRCLESD